MPNLFRKEASEGNREKIFGSVLIVAPLPFRILAGIVAMIVLALIAYLFWGQYSRKVTVSGYLTPGSGLIHVFTARRGLISKKTAKNGERVEKGSVLFIVSPSRNSAYTPEANAALIGASKQAQQTLLKQINIAKQLRDMKVAQLKQNLKGLNVQYDKLQQQIATQKALQEKLKLEALEKSKANYKNKIAAIPINIALVKSKTAQQIANYKQQLYSLKEKIIQLGTHRATVIRAPHSGIITSAAAQAGQMVMPDVPLATILPTNSKLVARLLVPSQAIGYIQTGQTIRLRYSAFPYRHFGLFHGKVIRISNYAVSPEKLPTTVRTRAELYPVTVEIPNQTVTVNGQPQKLRAGMALSADIVLNHQPLYQWIFAPAYSARGRN